MKLKMEQLSFSYSTKNIFCGLSLEAQWTGSGRQVCGDTAVGELCADVL